MSKRNVEIVRICYDEGHARRTIDVPGLQELLSPDFRFHARPGWPGQTVYRADEMTALWADLDTTFTDHSLVATAYEDLGDHVMVTLDQSARLRESDQEINQTLYHLWHVSEGKIQEARTFLEKADALAAAGISE